MPLHRSVKLNAPCEMINVTPLNPLISKCQIKVCYVSDQPNRNNSIITKEVARGMANSLPGSPIVGYFNDGNKDFEEHNRSIEISQGEMKLVDTTKPYGFVDLGAKVWFQKFQEGGVEREYLMTEGYLWTGQYPECERIIKNGNNQSMELDEKTIKAHWAKDKNGDPQFFIINEAIISKLCILGENYEPCFEGAQITKVQFSFDDGFKEKLFSMMNELKELLNEGGVSVDEKIVTSEETTVVEETPVVVEEPVVEEAPAANTEFAKDNEEDKKDTEEKKCPKCGKPENECECDDEDEDKKKEFSKDKDDEEKPAEDKCPECGKSKEECTCEDKKEDKKDKYNLNEIPEYMELVENYNTLQSQYSALETEVSSLREFKVAAERKDKEAMIADFYMLSDEDKKDVIDNIDTYSLDDIEAKLSIICVRNKVSFDLNTEEKKEDEVVTYSMNNDVNDDMVPAFVKAMRDVAKNM